MKKLIFAFICLFLVIPCQAGVIYVDADANGANDGTSWGDAYNYLQDALAAASSGDEIWVAEGIYKPDQDSAHPYGTSDRYATFQLITGVTIRGGYGGFGETDPDVRDIDAYETILTGDLDGDDGPNFTYNAENSYHVVTADDPGIDNSAILDGFIITGGRADGDWQLGYNDGAGIHCYESTPTIRNCIITGNSTDNIGYAGGMCSYLGSTPTVVENCTFTGNYARDGGGMMNWLSNVTLINCTFSENSTYDAGAGIGNWSSSLTLANCIFTKNSAGHKGGGMYNYGIGPTTVTNCTFQGNSAGDSAGGMYNYDNSPILTNCIFWDNDAGGNYDDIHNGGSSDPTVTYSDIEDGYSGEGNIDVDPCFADPCNGDYHLKTFGWRWDMQRKVWTWDDVTSRCIDAGNPGSPLGEEPLSVPRDPNNDWGQNLRINMGVYGGTAEASMAPFNWALLADLTNDGTVNFEDYAGQAIDWLESESEQPGDLNRDGTVDIYDVALLTEDWLEQTSWYVP